MKDEISLKRKRSKIEFFKKNELVNPILKFLKKKGLVFVLINDTQFGYRAFESKHSIMISAKSRSELIEEIKNEVKRHFGDNFYGKIVLREFIDEEIKL